MQESAAPKSNRASSGALNDITSSDLLRLMAAMAALVGIVTSIADVQFNEIVDRIYPSKDAKTAFFGQFFAGLSALAFVVQLGFTQRIVRSWGATSALLFLPLSLAFGSLAVLVYPSLVAAIALKLGDGSFRHSIHKSATEILFLPLPADVKQRTKVLLDTTVDNLANGLGALLVLAATGLGLAYRHLSWVSLGLILLWIFLIARSRQAYVGAFRRALERREIDVDQATLDFSEAAAFDALLSHLDSGNQRRVLYVLDALAGGAQPAPGRAHGGPFGPSP